jgi:hypothetical protein
MPHTTVPIHAYPASLSFQGISLTLCGVVTFQHFGVQEKLLRTIMDEDGPKLMMTSPCKLRSMYSTYGFQPVFPSHNDAPGDKVAARHWILTALLDNRRRSIITHLAEGWFDGSFAPGGCSMQLIMEWIAGFTSFLSIEAKAHWRKTLEDVALPPETKLFLHYSNFAWKNLQGFLRTMMRPDEVKKKCKWL